jgi:hypothetical protein
MNNYKLKIIDLKSDVIWQTNVTSENYNINMNTFGKTGLYFLQIINSSSVIIETKKIILY